MLLCCGSLKLVLGYVFGISVCTIFWPWGLVCQVFIEMVRFYHMCSLRYTYGVIVLVGLVSHVIRKIII